ncbi:MAG: right-handed parallel beta-helix repeat-containing protein [Deltaproteobacteria bacterium]|nr:right-handed parallel beta-helix repeat-containing protein [Deltaproteobacteria bacterium]
MFQRPQSHLRRRRETSYPSDRLGLRVGLSILVLFATGCSFVPDTSNVFSRPRDGGVGAQGDGAGASADVLVGDAGTQDTDGAEAGDAGRGVGPDVGMTQAGAGDAGASDVGVREPGVADGGVVDGGVVDAGVVDAGLPPEPTTCGNGRLENPEVCDDGNTAVGDGCAADCLVEPDWLCLREPSVCVPLGDAVYVEAGGFGCNGREGSSTDPFCKIADGLNAQAAVVIVRPGVYNESPTSKRDVVVVAYPGVEIRGRWSVDGGDAEIVGVSFVGSSSYAVRVRSSASLVLSDCSIQDSSGFGVEIESSASARLDRNFISESHDGGVRIDTLGTVVMTSNVLVGNGGSGSSFGGIRVERVGQGSRFAYNTIVANRAQSGRAAGVRCDVDSVNIRNSIIWGNRTPSLSDECVVEWSIIGPNVAVSGSNLGEDPELLDFHLTASSPAIDRADADGLEPRFDIDGDFRIMGVKPDIGADEFLQ